MAGPSNQQLLPNHLAGRMSLIPEQNLADIPVVLYRLEGSLCVYPPEEGIAVLFKPLTKLNYNQDYKTHSGSTLRYHIQGENENDRPFKEYKTTISIGRLVPDEKEVEEVDDKQEVEEEEGEEDKEEEDEESDTNLVECEELPLEEVHLARHHQRLGIGSAIVVGVLIEKREVDLDTDFESMRPKLTAERPRVQKAIRHVKKDFILRSSFAKNAFQLCSGKEQLIRHYERGNSHFTTLAGGNIAMPPNMGLDHGDFITLQMCYSCIFNSIKGQPLTIVYIFGLSNTRLNRRLSRLRSIAFEHNFLPVSQDPNSIYNTSLKPDNLVRAESQKLLLNDLFKFNNNWTSLPRTIHAPAHLYALDILDFRNVTQLGNAETLISVPTVAKMVQGKSKRVRKYSNASYQYTLPTKQSEKVTVIFKSASPDKDGESIPIDFNPNMKAHLKYLDQLYKNNKELIRSMKGPFPVAKVSVFLPQVINSRRLAIGLQPLPGLKWKGKNAKKVQPEESNDSDCEELKETSKGKRKRSSTQAGGMESSSSSGKKKQQVGKGKGKNLNDQKSVVGGSGFKSQKNKKEDVKGKGKGKEVEDQEEIPDSQDSEEEDFDQILEDEEKTPLKKKVRKRERDSSKEDEVGEDDDDLLALMKREVEKAKGKGRGKVRERNVISGASDVQIEKGMGNGNGKRQAEKLSSSTNKMGTGKGQRQRSEPISSKVIAEDPREGKKGNRSSQVKDPNVKRSKAKKPTNDLPDLIADESEEEDHLDSEEGSEDGMEFKPQVFGSKPSRSRATKLVTDEEARKKEKARVAGGESLQSWRNDLAELGDSESD